MKKTITLLFLTLCVFNSFSQEKLKLKGILITNDYHEKISWIKSKPISLVKKDFTVNINLVSNIEIYFGAKMVEGKQKITPIRLVNNYVGKNWIFFDEVSYLLGSNKEIRQGKGMVFKIKDDKVKRSVTGIKVHEQSDIIAIQSAKEFIKYVANKKETGLTIRFTNKEKGQYVEIKVPKGTKHLKKNFKALILAYERICEMSGVENEF